MTRNDKNRTSNNVGMFLVQNQVIEARFSTLPSQGLLRWCAGLENLSKLDKNIFSRISGKQ